MSVMWEHSHPARPAPHAGAVLSPGSHPATSWKDTHLTQMLSGKALTVVKLWARISEQHVARPSCWSEPYGALGTLGALSHAAVPGHCWSCSALCCNQHGAEPRKATQVDFCSLRFFECEGLGKVFWIECSSDTTSHLGLGCLSGRHCLTAARGRYPFRCTD